MKIRNIIIYPFLITVPLANGTQNSVKKEATVLFVGISFTYFSNITQMLNAMATQEKVPIQVKQSTIRGSTLKKHFNKDKGAKTSDYLGNTYWDYVIL
jgi:hypothetical protein